MTSHSTWLIDTGPIVAYLDADDPHHSRVAELLDGFTGVLATTSAVITEAMHLVASDTRGPGVLADWVAGVTIDVYDFSAAHELQVAADLIDRYGDVPMDFADATLLLLSEVLDQEMIVTLDRRGFSAYRTRDGVALVNVFDLDDRAR